MHFEILNIIKFAVLVILLAIVFGWLKRKKVITAVGWGTYFGTVVLMALFTYTQFFTLTNDEGLKSVQGVMGKQGSQIRNGRVIGQYLEENKEVPVDKLRELEEERLRVDMVMAEAAKVNGNSVIYYPIGQKPDYVETRMGQIK